MKHVPQLTVTEAVALVKDGDTLLQGGFGMTGNPVHLMHALAETGTKNLTFIGNNVGEPGLGGGRLLRNGQIKKMIGSFFTSNPDAVKAAQTGTVAYELLPQGSLAEAIRAGGAGIGGFYTPTAAGTLIAEGRDTKMIDGVEQVFVKSIRGNVAFIRAWRADTAGNLTYRMTEQNFNRAMATAADLVIAEVEEIVPEGELDPNFIHTPGCFVDYLVQASLTTEDLGTSASVSASKRVDESRMNMARRALAELRRGDVVNLGIGIPTLVADLIKPEHGIILHTENGMLGVGPAPEDGGGAMDYPVNAGKIPVTALPGSSYFDSADSFGMIRGRHVDVAIMGGLEVDEAANLANWAVPGKPLLGVGGAMDLASGAKRLIITMTHTNPDGSSKIVPHCTLPLTASGVVTMVITDLAVFTFEAGQLTLIELMPGAELDDVRAKTSAHFSEKTDLAVMKDAFIIDAIRTPIGSFGGSLAPVRADDLAAFVLTALMERNPNLPPDAIEDVIMGCHNQAGEDNRNVARMALLLAGLPYTIPGETVNRLCSSGMSAVVQANRAIRAGDGDVFIAGGVEHMTRGPWVISKTSKAFGNDAQMVDSSFGWRFVNPRMEELYGIDPMGMTAENVAELYNISREDQDLFAYHSQQRAARARDSGRFAQEIKPVPIPQPKGAAPVPFVHDEFMKPQTALDTLAQLKPAFKKGGTVTAGNAAGLNDGAAAMLVASEEAANRFGLTPMARIISSGVVGVEPRIMGIGPVGATQKALARAGLTLDQMDIIEFNEAFAAQSLACIRLLGLADDDSRVNPNGGAIALGHPLGMSGTRVLQTLAIELHQQNKRYGLATMCVGVGQGYAVVIEKV